MDIKYLGNITDIRRTLKKIGKKSAVDIAKFNSYRAVLSSVPHIRTGTVTASRAKARILALASLESKAQLLTTITEHRQALQHMESLVRNEFTQEYIVSKLLKDIVTLAASLDQVLDNTDTPTTGMPVEIQGLVRQCRRFKLGEQAPVGRTLITSDGQSFIFTHYLEFSNVTDKSNFNYPSYYIMLRQREAVLAVATSSTFIPPERINGTVVQDQPHAIKILRRHFVKNNLL